VAELVERMTAALAAARAAHRAATEGATHEQARPENSKDTRGLEQSYLARGQATRVAELEEQVALLQTFAPRAFAAGDRVALGALVEVDDDGTRHRYFIAPHGGGEQLASGTVHVLTPASPLGQLLLGTRPGDTIEHRLRTTTRELEVISLW
jgi:transcription elongation GreA/GreB family factor